MFDNKESLVTSVRVSNRRQVTQTCKGTLAVISSAARRTDERLPSSQERFVRHRYSLVLDSIVKVVSNNVPIAGIVLILAICTCGCGLPKRQFASITGLGDKMSLQVVTSNEANQNSPVAMDIVVVRNKKLLGTLDHLTASSWFQKRAQIELDHPGKIKVLKDLQLVPGQTYGPVKLHFPPKYQAGILFVNYFTPGAHRAVIDIHKPLVVDLHRNNFTIQKNK